MKVHLGQGWDDRGDWEGMEKIPEIEEILSSKGRVRILKVLAAEEELNISKIADLTGLNNKTAKEHLNNLVQMHILLEKRYGRIRVYLFRRQHPEVRKLEQFFRWWALRDGKHCTKVMLDEEDSIHL